MIPSALLPLLLLLLGSAALLAAAAPAPSITHDVCVVGAGGSGAYAAVRLKQLGKRVLVLEQYDRVGGHCDTFYPPPGSPSVPNHVERGVIYFANTSIIRDTYAAFNVTLVPYNIQAQPEMFLAPVISFDGRGQYHGFTIPPNALSYPAFLEALQLLVNRSMTWISVFEAQFPYIDTPNAANTDFSKLDAATLTMLFQPFGQLLDRLEAEVGSFAPLYGPWEELLQGGYGPLREVPAYTALRTLRPATARFILGSGFTAANGCSELYAKFGAYLRSSLVLSATHVRIKRRPSYVVVDYQQQGGQSSRAYCDKLLVATPQDEANLRSFITDLDAAETAVFSQVTSNTLAAAIIKLPAADVPGPLPYFWAWTNNWTLAEEPIFAGMFKTPNGYGVADTLYPTPPHTIHLNAARKTMLSNVKHVAQASHVLSGPASGADVDMKRDDLHTYWPRPKDVQSYPAFCEALYALQGHRRTYYTGALLSFNLQHDVWRYSEWLVSTYFGGPPFTYTD